MEQIVVLVLTIFLGIMNILSFTLMGTDKHKAVRKEWRIPERTLIMAAFLGGGIGAFLGMYVFRHKTKHLKFILLLPIAAILNVFEILIIYQII